MMEFNKMNEKGIKWKKFKIQRLKCRYQIANLDHKMMIENHMDQLDAIRSQMSEMRSNHFHKSISRYAPDF